MRKLYIYAGDSTRKSPIIDMTSCPSWIKKKLYINCDLNAHHLSHRVTHLIQPLWTQQHVMHDHKWTRPIEMPGVTKSGSWLRRRSRRFECPEMYERIRRWHGTHTGAVRHEAQHFVYKLQSNGRVSMPNNFTRSLINSGINKEMYMKVNDWIWEWYFIFLGKCDRKY